MLIIFGRRSYFIIALTLDGGNLSDSQPCVNSGNQITAKLYLFFPKNESREMPSYMCVWVPVRVKLALLPQRATCLHPICQFSSLCRWSPSFLVLGLHTISSYLTHSDLCVLKAVKPLGYKLPPSKEVTILRGCIISFLFLSHMLPLFQCPQLIIFFFLVS